MSKLIAAAAVLWLAISFPLVSHSRNLALIVGVDQYPSLTSGLEGPGNDAIEVATFLRDHGFDDGDITVLTDVTTTGRIRVTGLPTNVNIRGAFGKLSQVAKLGDFVYLHFGGHGSLEPVVTGELKKGGLEGIFLPRDIGKWEAGQRVSNALRDDDFLDAITRIRNSGAFVWAVFDSCNSGDIARGAPSPERARRVAMAELGIPPDAIEKARHRAQVHETEVRGMSVGDRSFLADPRIPLSPRAGSVVVFSAAQSYGPTFETLLSQGGASVWHGVFTMTLLQTLNQYPGLAYRQIAQQIVARYASMNRAQATPFFQGDLDAIAFGMHGARVAQPQWPVHVKDGTAYLAAGSLAEVGPGSVLALMQQPAEPTTEALGYVEVVSSTLNESELRPTSWHAKPVIEVGSLLPPTYGRLVQRGYTFTLKTARPCDAVMTPDGVNSSSIPCRSANPRVIAAVNSLANQQQDFIRWVDAGEPSADVRLVVAAEKIWFTPSSGELARESTPAIDIDGGAPLRDRLEDTLRRIAKATNLIKLVTGESAGNHSVEVQVFMRPPNSAANVAYEPVSWTKTPRPGIASGSDLRIRLHNTSKAPLDVTLLYLDARWGITPLYPQTSGRNNRIKGGDSDETGGGGSNGQIKINANPAGDEYLLVIAVPAHEQQLSTDFSFLAQPTLPVGRGAQRGSGFQELLTQAGFTGGVTRGAIIDGSEGLLTTLLPVRTMK